MSISSLSAQSKNLPTVVCAADNGYAMPLAVMLLSVLDHLEDDDQIAVFVIDGGIRESNRKKILKFLDSQKLNIHWIRPNESHLKNVKLSGHITLASYYRLLIPDLLPSWLDKVVYLDCDIIVKNNIKHLWNLEVKDYPLLAAQDMAVMTVSSEKGLLNYQELGIPAHYKYFNAGVLLINLAKWRSERIGTTTIKYIQQNPQYIRWWDQDGLNAVLAGTWGELDPKWNQQPQIYGFGDFSWNLTALKQEFDDSTRQEIVDFPYIIHYTTSRKPWNYGSKHPRCNLFFEYVDRTAWKGFRPRQPFRETPIGKYCHQLKQNTPIDPIWTRLKQLSKAALKPFAKFL